MDFIAKTESDRSDLSYDSANWRSWYQFLNACFYNRSFCYRSMYENRKFEKTENRKKCPKMTEGPNLFCTRIIVIGKQKKISLAEWNSVVGVDFEKVFIEKKNWGARHYNEMLIADWCRKHCEKRYLN